MPKLSLRQSALSLGDITGNRILLIFLAGWSNQTFPPEESAGWSDISPWPFAKQSNLGMSIELGHLS
jgi:hypothetical protein